MSEAYKLGSGQAGSDLEKHFPDRFYALVVEECPKIIACIEDKGKPFSEDDKKTLGEALYRLGQAAIFEREGVEPNRKGAKKLWIKAYELGNSEAAKALEKHFPEAYRAENEKRKAEREKTRAEWEKRRAAHIKECLETIKRSPAEVGDEALGKAYLSLGEAHRSGILKENPEEAAGEYLLKAAKLGNSEARKLLEKYFWERLVAAGLAFPGSF